MTGISSTITTGAYTGNGSQTVFPFDFTVASATELAVQVNGVTISSALYTVSVGDTGTGSVTFLTAPVTAASVLLVSSPDWTQDNQFESEGAYKLDTVNRINRRQGIRSNWLAKAFAPLLPAASLTAASRIGKFLAWDANGDAVAASGTGTDAAFRTDAAASGGSALIGFIQTGVGAIVRAVQNKLRNGWFDVEDFGVVHPNGATDDTAVFQAAYDAAATAGRGLRLPQGIFKVTGLVWRKSIPVQGAGPSNTIFVPSADGQTVIDISDRTVTNTSGDAWTATGGSRGYTNTIGGFAVNLTSRTGCIGMRTIALVSTDLAEIHVFGDDYITYARQNTGWKSIGDQYSSYRNVYIERLYVGHQAKDAGSATGGGLNNHYDGLHIAYCYVNLMMYNTGTLPMGLNHFTNVILQNSQHCALYLQGQNTVFMTMNPPEALTATSATVVIDGQTIKKGAVHCNGSQLQMLGYDHATNDTAMVVRAENYSTIECPMSTGAATTTLCDDTSTFRWAGKPGNNSVFTNTETSFQATSLGASVLATQAPTNDRAFPNAIAGALSVPIVTYGGGASHVLNSDPDTIVARRMTLPVGGSVVVDCDTTADYPAASRVGVSILLRSTTDTSISYNFAQSTASGVVALTANRWTRFFITNITSLTLSRSSHITFTPTGSDTPVVDVAMPVGLTAPTAMQLRALSERHIFNSKDTQGNVVRGTAAPTTGTWALGDIVWNSAPAVGTPLNWVCTTAGTPGTWATASSGGGGSGKWEQQFRPNDNEPPASNYATLDLRNNHPVLNFDTTTQETAIFSGALGANYAGGGLTVNVYCALATATSGTVGWDVAIERMDASSLDTDADSFGSAATITAVTVPGTSGQLLKMSVNLASGTAMDSLAAGEMFRVRLRRDVANDTAAGDAQLLGVMVREQ